MKPSFVFTKAMTIISLVAFTASCSDGGTPNQKPNAVSETVNVEVNTATEFTLSATDPDGGKLTYSITSQPASGSLESLDTSGQRYRFTPQVDDLSTNQVGFSVSDGELLASAVITLDIVDTSAPLASQVSPQSGAIRVALASEISVAFNDIMETINYDSNVTECNGGLQISADDFSSCVGFSNVALSTDKHTFTLTPSVPLVAEKTYQVRVNASAQNFHATGAAEAVVGTFTTLFNNLKITEVSDSRYTDDNRWFEVFNATDRTLQLSDYALKAGSINLDDFSDAGIRTFTLPSAQLAPGDYLVVQGRFGNGYWQSSVAQSSQLVLVGNTTDNIRPKWYANGFVELLTSDLTTTVDFVRFGNNLQAPVTATEWTSADAAPAMNAQLATSLVRSLVHTDTNSSMDWRYASFITPGGNNDINCMLDEDIDGIPDCAEVEGATFAGLPLYTWGARQGVKDIFIEVDYMQSDDAGIIPHKAALQKVVDVFASHGYAVHFDAGSLYHAEAGISPENFDLGGGNQINFYAQTTFVSSDTAPSIIDHKVQNFDLRRRPIFHYMLMANSQNADGSGGSSGVAEINGNDLIISMGNWGLTLNNEAATNATLNYQSSTIMHELGHNLGLQHGGNENVNNKPNFLSIMNYLYQLRGLPTIGNNEGDRYYSAFFRNNANCNVALVNGPTSPVADFKMDYSLGTAPALDEASVVESLGFGLDDSDAIDFNCNSSLDETLVDIDLNGNGETNNVLSDVNEWDLVTLNFASFWNGSVSGTPQANNSNENTRDIINNDRQSIILETPPSAEFFESIKAIQ